MTEKVETRCGWCGTADLPEGRSFCSRLCQEENNTWDLQERHPLERRNAESDNCASSHPETVADMKPTNPKDIIGSGKLPLHLWPETASAMGCVGMLDGALKYGRGNYRAIGVKASIYIDACKRHLNAWFEGEENAPDSGVPHLSHALACVAIIVDAQAAGKLNDDRNTVGGYLELVGELTPHVERLKKAHADKSPKHYTIADEDPTESELWAAFDAAGRES